MKLSSAVKLPEKIKIDRFSGNQSKYDRDSGFNACHDQISALEIRPLEMVEVDVEIIRDSFYSKATMISALSLENNYKTDQWIISKKDFNDYVKALAADKSAWLKEKS